MRVFCIYFSSAAIDQVQLQSFAESCYVLTPQIALGENWIFLEVSKCKKLYSEKTIYFRIQVLLKKWNLKAQISLADDMPNALCQILFRQREMVNFPIEAMGIYFQPFKLTKQFESVIQTFKKLGMITLGDLFQIPKSELISRLGRSLAMTLRHIKEADQILWPKFVMNEEIMQVQVIDELSVVKDLEPLLFVIKNLLDVCFLRLKAQDKSLTHLYLKIEMEKFSVVQKPLREIIVDFPFPQNHVLSVLQVLKTKLDHEFQIKPIESEVKSVQIKILKTAPRTTGQTDLFHKKEESLESLYSLIARLMESLGKEKVFFASSVDSYLPEKMWKKTVSEPIDLNAPQVRRPVRIFQKPIKVQIEDGCFVLTKKKFEIIQTSNLEKIYSDWWVGEGERQYQEAVIQNRSDGKIEMMRVWFFEKESETYLHGLFD